MLVLVSNGSEPSSAATVSRRRRVQTANARLGGGLTLAQCDARATPRLLGSAGRSAMLVRNASVLASTGDRSSLDGESLLVK